MAIGHDVDRYMLPPVRTRVNMPLNTSPWGTVVAQAPHIIFLGFPGASSWLATERNKKLS